MKRSQMIWRIQSELNDKGACMMYHNPDEGVTEELAEHVLWYIEKLGMLPPSTGKLTTNYSDMGLMAEHSWEPEDE